MGDNATSIPAAEVRRPRCGWSSTCNERNAVIEGCTRVRTASACYESLACVPQAVLVPGNTIPDTPIIRGYDFNTGRDLDGLMSAMLTSGFQATTLGQAVEEVNRMVRAWQMGPPHHQGEGLFWWRSWSSSHTPYPLRPGASLATPEP